MFPTNMGSHVQTISEPSMVAHTANPALQSLRQESWREFEAHLGLYSKFQASLSCNVRLSPKKKKIQNTILESVSMARDTDLTRIP